MVKEQEIEFAKKVVNEASHSFLSKEDIIANFEENNFLISENKNIGFVSHIDYDKQNGGGILSYDGEKSLKEQQQILLMNYCIFMLDSNMHVKYYYREIPSKSALKRISRYIINASVDKEFGGDSFNAEVKEGIKK